MKSIPTGLVESQQENPGMMAGAKVPEISEVKVLGYEETSGGLCFLPDGGIILAGQAFGGDCIYFVAQFT